MILDQVITKLVTIFTTAGATTYDGPVPTSVNKTDYVLVGSDAEDGDGAVVELIESDLGPGTWVDETGEVVCSAWSWSGGTNIAACRAAAEATAVACIAAIRADRTLGGLLTGPRLAEVSVLRYEPKQTSKGAICRFTFSVLYRHLNT